MTRQDSPTLAAILLLTVMAPCHAATLQVPTSFPRIYDAIAAASPGDTVLVAAGIYATSVNGEVFPLSISKAIHLLGAGPGVTTLDAEAGASVINVPAAPGGHISGFTLTGGRALEGAGLHISAGAPEVDDCLIFANSAFRHGSGIYVTGAATPWIHHNVIWASEDWDHFDSADPHGIDLRGGNGVVEHNIVGRGVSNGIFIQAGSAPTVRNNILFENGTPGVRGRGICAFGDAGTIIAHNLFHANAIAALVVPASPFVDVTAAQANGLSPNDGIYGNLDGDPLFTDPDGFDWSLSPGSPAIDSGDPLTALDPDGTVADIGPHFFDQTVSAAPDPTPTSFMTGTPNPFRSSITLQARSARPTSAAILIFDVSGRIIHTLQAGVSGDGSFSVTWNGRDQTGRTVPPSTYYAVSAGPGGGVVKIVRLP